MYCIVVAVSFYNRMSLATDFENDDEILLIEAMIPSQIRIYSDSRKWW